MSEEGPSEERPAAAESGGSDEPPPGGAGEQAAGPGQPSEEELRRRVEEQLRKVRVQDLLLESTVSVINLAARRIGKEDERDLEQARVGIEAVRALVDFLDPEPAQQVRAALSEVQLMYANAAGGEPAGEAPGAEPPGAGDPGPRAGTPPRQAGGRPSKLWTPPGT